MSAGPPFFIAIDGQPERYGLPPEDAEAVMVASAFAEILGGQHLTVVVDAGTSQLLAQGTLLFGAEGVPLNFGIVRRARLGWPTEWDQLAEASRWLQRSPDGTVWQQA